MVTEYKKLRDKLYFAKWYKKNKQRNRERGLKWLQSEKGIAYLKRTRKLLPINERFWFHVEKKGENECWLWSGCKYPSGYGRIGLFYAHRFSYQLNVDNIPEGLHVCHSCDNPLCVNPKHLWAGTVADKICTTEIKREEIDIQS